MVVLAAAVALLASLPSVLAQNAPVTLSADTFQRMVYSAHLHTQLAGKPELDASLKVLLELHRRNPHADPASLAGLVRETTARYRTNAPAYIRTSGFRDEILAAYLDALRQVPERADFIPADLTLLGNFMLGPANYNSDVPPATLLTSLVVSGNQRFFALEGGTSRRKALVDDCLTRSQGNAAFAAALDQFLGPETGVSLADTAASIIGRTNSPLHDSPTLQTLLALSQGSGDGSLTVSTNQVMDLFAEEMQTIWGIINTNLAVRAQINQDQPDLLAYLTNQAAIDANVQLWTEVQRDQPAKLACATAAVLVQSELLPVDSGSGEAVRVGSAMASIGIGIASLCTGRVGGLESVLSGGLEVINLFSGTQSPQDKMANQIRNVQTLLGDLSQNMDYRFDRVDQSLTTMFAEMNQQFSKIEFTLDAQGRQIAQLRGNVDDIRSSLVNVQASLNRLEQDIFFGFATSERNQYLIGPANSALFYEVQNPGRTMTWNEYAVAPNYENTFYSYAASYASDNNLSPQLSLDLSADNLAQQLAVRPMDANLNYIAQFLSANLGQSTGGNSPLANPQEWFMGAYAYLQLATENPMLYREKGSRLPAIISVGQNLTNFLGSLTFDGLHINQRLYTALTDRYLGNLSSFNSQVAAFEGAYATNHDFALGAWRMWDTRAPRLTAAGTEVRASDPNPSLLGLPNPVTGLAAGFAHSLALRADGTVVAWGDRSLGQTAVPAAATNVLALTASQDHSLALKTDGAVVAWGDNHFGQTNVPTGLSNVTAIAAGFGHNLALDAHGTVVSWGNDAYGQTNIPTGLGKVVAIAAGATHSLAAQADGTVVAWGGNGDGETDIPPGLSNVVSVAAGAGHSLALQTDGTVVGWGAGSPGALDPALSFNGAGNVVTVTNQAALNAYPLTVSAWIKTTQNRGNPTGIINKYASSSINGYQLFLRNGNLRAWYFQGPISGGFRGVYDGGDGLNGGFVADGLWHHVAFVVDAGGGRLFVDGALKATMPWTGAPGAPTTLQPATWGAYPGDPGGGFYSGQLDEVRLWNVARSQSDLRADMLHSLMGTEPGLIACWKLNEDTGSTATNSAVGTGSACDGQLNGPTWVTGRGVLGQATIPAGLSNVVAIAAAGNHSLALKADGTAVCWGQNDSGQCNVPAGLNHLKTVAAGAFHNLALKTNGTLVSWGANTSGQRIVPVLLGWQRALSYSPNAGELYLGLRKEGTAIEWGYSWPLIPSNVRNLVAVVINGAGRALAIKSDGTLWSDSSVPAPPSSATNLADIASGYGHYLALRKDGALVAWGDNSNGQVNIPAGLNDVAAISAGLNYNLALRRNGTVVGWGYNWSGQANVPAGLTNVVAISAGYDGNCVALKADGTLAAWGNNFSGRTNVPPGLSNVVALSADACLAIRADGTVAGWGSRGSGFPPEASNVVAVAGGDYSFSGSVAVRGDGTVVGWFNGNDCDWNRGQTDLSALDFQAPIDSTTNRYSAVRLGATPVQVDSPLPGFALSFDGVNDCLTTPDLAGRFYPVTATVTLELWFLARGPGVLVDEHFYAGQYHSSQIELVTTATNSAFGEVRIRILPLASPGLSLGTVQYGNWNHVALRHNSASSTLDGFLNGIAGPTASVSRSIGSYALSYSIGSWESQNLGSGARFNGMVDELRIWNVARSQADIQDNMHHALSGTEPGLVAYWRFDEAPQVLPKQVRQLSAGYQHSLGLLDDGTVVGFGANDYGQASAPGGLANAIAVSAGGSHSLALRADGTVVAWGVGGCGTDYGAPDYGQVSVPPGLSNVVAIAAGAYHSLALQADGTVVAWGRRDSTNLPPLLNNVVAIAAGNLLDPYTGGYSMALKADGTVVEWGSYANTPPSGLNHVVAIAAGSAHSLALRDNGEVVAWGNSPQHGQTNVPPEARTDVVAIAAGRMHSLALKRDGTVVTWSGQAVDRFTVPPGLSNVVDISAGGYHSLYLTASSASGTSPDLRLPLVRARIPARVVALFQDCNQNTIHELGLTGSALDTAAAKLTGSKMLLADILELGMPYTLAQDDVLRGFLYGSESLTDTAIASAFLLAQNERLQGSPSAPAPGLVEWDWQSYLRFKDRLDQRLADLQTSGSPEIPRLVGHTLRLLNLLNDAHSASPSPALEIGQRGNELYLLLHGEPYAHYTLQASDNLDASGWGDTLVTNLHSEQPMTPPASGPSRFYRAVLPSP